MVEWVRYVIGQNESRTGTSAAQEFDEGYGNDR